MVSLYKKKHFSPFPSLEPVSKRVNGLANWQVNFEFPAASLASENKLSLSNFGTNLLISSDCL